MLSLLLSTPTWATAVFEAPARFQKAGAGADIDVSPQAESLIRFGQHAYARAADDARMMQAAIDAFLSAPSETGLAEARRSWRQARPAYQRTEMLRFFNSPIDHAGDDQTPPGPEPRINAWPLNEAHIDYVEGAPKAGLIQRLDLPIEVSTILHRDQFSDESDITTGWHAIEFLLWGQDLSADGPG
ncbi:MAG: hypothetical protein KDI51_14240, partial [Xanthomonadales bacterium]|nr:hypothetical protein [Xanthomonadales bacterium]